MVANHFTSLISLDASNTNIYKTSKVSQTSPHQLLNLQRLVLDNNRITSEMFSMLCLSFPSLSFLSLAENQIEGLLSLLDPSQCSFHSKLEVLILKNVEGVTDEFCRLISEAEKKAKDAFPASPSPLFPSLRRLDLSGCDVTDDGIRFLSSCSFFRSLWTLSLANCMITDVGVLDLPHSLLSLSLESCDEVSDVAIQSLCCNCNQLGRLNVCWCTKLTSVSIDAMVKYGGHLKWVNLEDCVEIDLDEAKARLKEKGVVVKC
eukprot:TRINITY_DN1955_c0_g3_i3.p1 TRINITY_DN1955_c0_g3~~TRINITY_DN1955_c0_g3_i3.p1  ORF type:complete len:261 (-),score=81.44 TRINITY_DN1955_c0_g3_i3:247-1029(-)